MCLPIGGHAEQVKINQEPFFVFDDPGFTRADAEIVGDTGPGILHPKREGERFRRFDLRSEWVVCIDIALLEVLKLELSIREESAT